VDELTRLALAAADGDRSALASFVRRTQPDVWHLCRHLVDADAADDLTQETYLRAARSLPAFRAEGSARSWLLAIARRTAADEIRRRRRRRRLERRVDAGRRDDQVPGPAGGVELADLLAGLPEQRRAAFVLTQVIGLSYEAAAQVCDCPVGTIRSRVARAREALAAAFDDAGNRTAAQDDQ
jgi:RNA polymerase sigma-70 factor (ECF subfamily)